MHKAVQRSICFSKFCIQRDNLSASMTRLGSGFHPPSVVSETKTYLQNVQELVKQMEEINLSNDTGLSRAPNHTLLEPISSVRY